MPAGLTDSDSMFSLRVTPWHGLGAVLEQPPASVAEAIEASGLGWSVAKEPIAIDRRAAGTQDGASRVLEPIEGYYATVPQDTRQLLGIVGERYRIVQNEEAFAFVDQLLGSAMNFETAGSLHGGRQAWVLATLPEHVEAPLPRANQAADRRALPVRQTQGNAPGSKWAAVNAIVEYGDWIRPLREGSERCSRCPYEIIPEGSSSNASVWLGRTTLKWR
ncbi:MAG: DUF932 domain-containing protein [Solirubrobacteraceae bacterium]